MDIEDWFNWAAFYVNPENKCKHPAIVETLEQFECRECKTIVKKVKK